MRIGFDVSDLCTGRADGTTRYTRELAAWFPRLAPEHEWHYFAPCATRDLPPAFLWHDSPWPKYWTQTRLPFDLYRYPVDVLFMPIQQLPYIRPKTKTVAVIHDLAFHLYPEQFTYKDWMLLHVFTAYVAREADTIICVSQATADDVARYYGRTKNVSVIHHGVDYERFRPLAAEEKMATWQQLQTKYQKLRQPYLLYVGQIQPRKNLQRLVEAFEILSSTHPELQLVLAGGHGWLQKPIMQRIQESPIRERILTLGAVPDELLPVLYNQTEVFVLPSLYEGFGLPVLEAMACGTPVVTSNVSSLPEVAGNAAVLIDPLDTQSIAEGIEQAMRNKNKLREVGLEQAKKFTWKSTAEKTLRILTT